MDLLEAFLVAAGVSGSYYALRYLWAKVFGGPREEYLWKMDFLEFLWAVVLLAASFSLLTLTGPWLEEVPANFTVRSLNLLRSISHLSRSVQGTYYSVGYFMAYGASSGTFSDLCTEVCRGLLMRNLGKVFPRCGGQEEPACNALCGGDLIGFAGSITECIVRSILRTFGLDSILGPLVSLVVDIFVEIASFFFSIFQEQLRYFLLSMSVMLYGGMVAFSAPVGITAFMDLPSQVVSSTMFFEFYLYVLHALVSLISSPEFALLTGFALGFPKTRRAGFYMLAAILGARIFYPLILLALTPSSFLTPVWVFDETSLPDFFGGEAASLWTQPFSPREWLENAGICPGNPYCGCKDFEPYEALLDEMEGRTPGKELLYLLKAEGGLDSYMRTLDTLTTIFMFIHMGLFTLGLASLVFKPLIYPVILIGRVLENTLSYVGGGSALGSSLFSGLAGLVEEMFSGDVTRPLFFQMARRFFEISETLPPESLVKFFSSGRLSASGCALYLVSVYGDTMNQLLLSLMPAAFYFGFFLPGFALAASFSAAMTVARQMGEYPFFLRMGEFL